VKEKHITTIIYMGFEVVTAGVMKRYIFRDILQYNPWKSTTFRTTMLPAFSGPKKTPSMKEAAKRACLHTLPHWFSPWLSLNPQVVAIPPTRGIPEGLHDFVPY
jgi:hypothetical protein